MPTKLQKQTYVQYILISNLALYHMTKKYNLLKFACPCNTFWSADHRGDLATDSVTRRTELISTH